MSALVPFQNFPEESPRRATRKEHSKTRRASELSENHTRKSGPKSSPRTRKESPRFETRTSRETGEPYYVNLATKEATFEMPASMKPAEAPRTDPSLPNIEIRKSRSTGETYYYNTITKETMWERPQEVMYPVGSTLFLLSRAEDRVMQSFGIKTCLEIKTILDDSEMTEEEQVKYIVDNAKDTSMLRKYIRASNFNPDQLNIIGEMAPLAIGKIRDVVNKLIRTNSEKPDENDPDAEPECAILRAKVAKFYEAGNGITKSMWAKFISTAKTVMEGILSMTYDAFQVFWSKLPSMSQWLYVAQWFVTKGISLTVWISANPQVAYYTLMGINLFKQYGCKLIGEACKTLDWDPAEMEFIKHIRTAYPEALDINVKESLSAKILEFLQPKLQNVVIKSTGGLVIASCNGIQHALSAGSATGATTLGALALTNPVLAVGGALVMGAVALAGNAAADAIKEEAEQAAKEAVHWNTVRLAWTQVITLCNPLPCILEILKVTESGQTNKRERKVQMWKELAAKNISEVGAENATIPPTPILQKVMNLYTSLDPEGTRYNPSITVTQVEKVLDKYSREVVKPDIAPAEGTGMAAAVFSAITSAQSSSLYRTLRPPSRKGDQELTALKDFANPKYYTIKNNWIRVGIFDWLQREGICGDCKLKITRKEFESAEADVVEKMKLSVVASDTTLLNNWKLEFNDLKYSWELLADLSHDFEGKEPTPLLRKSLLGTLKAEIDLHLSALGESSRISLIAGLPTLLKDPYYCAAIAVHHIQLENADTEPIYKLDFPLWANECFKALAKSGVKPTKYLAVLPRESPDKPPSDLFGILAAEYELFRTSVTSTRDAKMVRTITEKTTKAKTVGELLKARYTKQVDAYYKFKLVSTATQKLCCVHLIRAIITPYRIFETAILQESGVKHSAGRTITIIDLLKCVLLRLDIPFDVNTAFPPFHDSDKVEEALKNAKLNPGKLNRAAIIKMWMFRQENTCYGYSQTFAKTQSGEYQNSFQKTKELRFEFERIAEDKALLQETVDDLNRAKNEATESRVEDEGEQGSKVTFLQTIQTAIEATKEKIATFTSISATEVKDAIAELKKMENYSLFEKAVSGSTNHKNYKKTLLDDLQQHGGAPTKQAENKEAKKNLEDHILTTETEFEKKWKDDVQKIIVGIQTIASVPVSDAETTPGTSSAYASKIRFTNCSITDSAQPKKTAVQKTWYQTSLELYKSATSNAFTTKALFKGHDTLSKYYNPVGNSDLIESVFTGELMTERANKLRSGTYIQIIPGQRMFSDSENPTTVQIFQNLGIEPKYI